MKDCAETPGRSVGNVHLKIGSTLVYPYTKNTPGVYGFDRFSKVFSAVHRCYQKTNFPKRLKYTLRGRRPNNFISSAKSVILNKSGICYAKKKKYPRPMKRG